jgi:hypothetical protein
MFSPKALTKLSYEVIYCCNGIIFTKHALDVYRDATLGRDIEPM